jgi:hypothetical protein
VKTPSSLLINPIPPSLTKMSFLSQPKRFYQAMATRIILRCKANLQYAAVSNFKHQQEVLKDQTLFQTWTPSNCAEMECLGSHQSSKAKKSAQMRQATWNWAIISRTIRTFSSPIKLNGRNSAECYLHLLTCKGPS